MRIQFYSNEGPGPLQRGDIKKCKNRVGSFKNLLNYLARKAEIYMKVFRHSKKKQVC
jgi:hypothetical protein